MIGINPSADKIRYVIIPDTCFYEFIPIEGEVKDNQTLTLDEVKVGSKYEIIITNQLFSNSRRFSFSMLFPI